MRILGFFCVLLMAAFITTAAYPQGHNMNNMGGNKTENKAMSDDQKSMKGGMKMDMMQMDRHFIENMIPHHQDASDMAKLALEKSKKSDIKKLEN